MVHGLFFMWLNPETKFLELIAPAVDKESTPKPCRHRLAGGIRGHLQEYANQNVDWTKIGLEGSDAPKPADVLKNVKSSVLQFSMNKVGLKQWSEAKNFAGRFILPWPVEIYSLRHDYFERSFVYNRSNVGDDIEYRCHRKSGTPDRNAEIGLVTCLQYTYEDGQGVRIRPWRPDINLHCYFEPCKKHSIKQVNDDLKNAARAFEPAGKFDLQLNEKALENVVTPIGRNPKVPYGCHLEDEYSLTDDPQKPKICADAGGCIGVLNVSPANCPNFFVGP
jgi:hypothetical protein